MTGDCRACKGVGSIMMVTREMTAGQTGEVTRELCLACEGSGIDATLDHEEDARLDNLVDRFAAVMKMRLHEKRQGFQGWDNPDYAGSMYSRLVGFVAYGQDRVMQKAVDIANLAAMLWDMNQKGEPK